MNKLVVGLTLLGLGIATPCFSQRTVCGPNGCYQVFPNVRSYAPPTPLRTTIKALGTVVAPALSERVLSAPRVVRVLAAPNVIQYYQGCGCPNCDVVNCTCPQSTQQYASPIILPQEITMGRIVTHLPEYEPLQTVTYQSAPVTYVTHAAPYTTSYEVSYESEGHRGLLGRIFERRAARRALRGSGAGFFGRLFAPRRTYSYYSH